MRRLFQAAFLLGVLFLAPTPSLEARPELDVKLKPSSLPVGQTSQLILQIIWKSEEGDYHFAAPKLALENLELETSGESHEVFEREGQTWQKKVFRFTLQALERGEGRISPFRLNYLDPETLQGGHFEVKVPSLKITPDRRPLYLGAAVAGGLLTFLGALGGGFVLYRQRSKKQASETSGILSLEERYLTSLQETHSLGEAGRLFRFYLCERYALPRKGGTSREVFGQLESSLSRDEKKTLKTIFDKLEEFEFGLERSGEGGFPSLRQEMIRFVEGKRVISI